MEIIAYVIAGICSIVVAIIEVRGARDRKSSRDESERAERRASRRAEESRLSMELMSASCKLGVVTAKAVTNQHVNGDVEEAMQAAKEAQDNYDAFLHAVAAYQTVKV